MIFHFFNIFCSKTLKTHQNIAATALKTSVGFVPRCEDSAGIKDLSTSQRRVMKVLSEQ